jgi:hypothetical protein
VQSLFVKQTYKSKSGFDFVSLSNKNLFMSIAEMKLAAITEISKLNDESAIKEILDHLAKLSSNQNETMHNLSQHFDEVAKRYGKVLEKLAQ